VRLVGSRSNRGAIGTKVLATVGEHTQVREIRAGSSYLGQNDTRVHFGVGTALGVDRLEIRWPSGRTETLTQVQAGRDHHDRRRRGRHRTRCLSTVTVSLFLSGL
jgi:hypothetical protein